MIDLIKEDKKKFLKNLPHDPGIYQMYDKSGEILYVGKAKNLKKRVASYFRKTGLDTKTVALMRQVLKIEVTITANESEALLLENNLIKKIKPRYNIFFKDDKSFPYLLLSCHVFPRLMIYRGTKEQNGLYFGPYPSASAVHETLHLMQDIFLLRSCKDIFFRQRTRPCLQYQIKRCSAPCVGYISEEEYRHNVDMLARFLRGKNKSVLHEMKTRMKTASFNRQYEIAARLRDQILNLEKIQTPQRVVKDRGDLDVIAFAESDGIFGLQILLVRSGAVVGSKHYFPFIKEIFTKEEIVSAFLERNYLDFAKREDMPKKILLNVNLPEKSWLKNLFREKLAAKVDIIDNVKNKTYKEWLRLALTNANDAISRKKNISLNLESKFLSLQKDLNLEKTPQKIECFDVTHLSSEATQAACVVFTKDGAQKNEYRRFNIEGEKKFDDYAAMRQALKRRFGFLCGKIDHDKCCELPAAISNVNLKFEFYLSKDKHESRELRIQKNEKPKCERSMPDILLIDGGRGQLNIASYVLKSLNIDDVALLAIAKNQERRKGRETIYYFIGGTIKTLDCSEEVLHFLQMIRDEAHRFAVHGLRKRYSKRVRSSALDSIVGLGVKRKSILLQKFGSLEGIKNADLDEIAKTPGITHSLAKKIYDSFHNVSFLSL